MSEIQEMTKENKEITEVTFHVAGVRYHDFWKVWGDLKPGDFLSMVREPTNEYDKNAVRLEFHHNDKNFMIGYVPAKLSPEVSELMTKYDLSCQAIDIDVNRPVSRQIKVTVRRIQ